MAVLPDLNQYDLTLQEVDKALEARQKLEAKRHYLGASEIGEECLRKLFYSFRYVEERVIPASGIRAIQDGFKQEDIMAERLRFLPYVELYTEDPDNPGNQINMSMLQGHFKGHLDGMILGIKEAPKTWHVWENKAVNEDKWDFEDKDGTIRKFSYGKFEKLKKIRKKKGEKNSLIEWDEIYYAQAQIYMYAMQVERHYLTVQTPGGRDYISIRTNLDKKFAEGIIEKANVIIFDNNNLPAKLSEKSDFYKCKWCAYSDICHNGLIPLNNCKTCIFSKPINNGERECTFNNQIIPKTQWLQSNCSNHLYNTALLQMQCIEKTNDYIVYKSNDGTVVANCSHSSFPPVDSGIQTFYTSDELRNNIQNTNNLTKKLIDVQKSFDGKIVGHDSRLQGI